MASHLAIDFSGPHVHFSLLRNDIVVNSFQTSLTSSKERENKESLDIFIKNNSALNDDFDEVTLSYATSRSTLVPNNIFDESGPKELFKLCFGKDTDDSEIDYNRISEHSVINLYQIPNWVKSFFVIKYPRIVIQHEGTHMIRQALQQGFKLKVYALVHQEHFQLSIIKHNEIQYYSAFDYQSHEDLIYHLLFVLQQKELTEEKGELLLINGAGSDNEILNEFMSNVKRVGDLSKFDVQQPEHFIAKSQLLCV